PARVVIDRTDPPVAKDKRGWASRYPFPSFSKRKIVNDAEFEIVRGVELPDRFLEPAIVLVLRAKAVIRYPVAIGIGHQLGKHIRGLKGQTGGIALFEFDYAGVIGGVAAVVTRS